MPTEHYSVGTRTGLSCACCTITLVVITENNVKRLVWTGPDRPVDQIEVIFTGQHPSRICAYCRALTSSHGT